MRATQIDADGVSREKQLDIIRTVIFSDKISRGEIAKLCGVSSMTVGKVISALIRAGLVRVEKAALGKGKNTELLSAADNINILVFCFEPQKLSVTLSDTRANVLFSHSQPVNDSIPYNSNIADLITSAYGHIERILREKLCAVSVISTDGIRSEDISVINSIIPDFYIDVLADSREYTADYMRENHSSKNLLFIRVGERVDLSLYCRGVEISSRNAVAIPREQISVEKIADILVNLSHIIIPDMVILEPDRALATNDLLPSLKNEFGRKSRTSENDMPEFTLADKTPIAVLSAIKRATDRIIASLVGETE